MWFRRPPEAGTMDGTEGLRDARCGAVKYVGLVGWRGSEEQSVTERGPLIFSCARTSEKGKEKKKETVSSVFSFPPLF